jgi:ABC-type Fe3+/spermidine/putrescine transport system ATPase subunit
MIYGRLKGLRKGEEVNHNVESLMQATALHAYADRLASKLSGGNQRKLALAIALIGNVLCLQARNQGSHLSASRKSFRRPHRRVLNGHRCQDEARYVGHAEKRSCGKGCRDYHPYVL